MPLHFARFLLPAYVAFETTRALLSFAAVRSHISVSPTIISFCSELLKLIFALVCLRRDLIADGSPGDVSSLKSAIAFAADSESPPWQSYGAFALPAVLYLVNNILYLIGLQLTTPALLHVAILAKLPLTGILHHFVVRKQKNVYAWISLTCICAGLLVCNVPSDLFSFEWFRGTKSNGAGAASTPAASLIVGPMIGLVIATLSAVASIFTEVIIKQDIAFMVAQVWLYSYGTLFAGLILLFWDGTINSFRSTSGVATTTTAELAWVVDGYAAVILATAATGLVVANILRKADNLVKLVGTSSAIVTIVVAQVILFPDLRVETVQVHTTLGVGIIAISTWTYNHYKSVPTTEDLAGLYKALSHEQAEEGEAGEYADSPVDLAAKGRADGSFELESPVDSETTTVQEDSTAPLPQTDLLKPNWKKVLAALLTLAWLAHATSLYAVQPLSTLPPRYGSTDVARFFVPRNITPAVWGETPNSIDCIQDWVDREQVYPLTSKFQDWETTYLESGCPVYPIPEGGLIFHVYWNGPWRPFNEVPIESFLATQRLGDGHRLIYWYENGEPTLAVRKRWTSGVYGKYVEFRRFDRAVEAVGYCVASMPEFVDEEYQRALNMPQNTRSDIVRVLLLAKYGGVWLDSDTMPIRDMTPMIRSGPSVPYFGGTRHNNNLLVFGPPDAGIGDNVLEVVCKMPYNETVFHEAYPTITPTASWGWLYNDGLLKLCEQFFSCNIARIPIWFTDGYAFEDHGQVALQPCDTVVTGAPVPAHLHSLWTWHTRLNQKEESCLDKGAATLIMSLRRRVWEMLEGGLEMGGRSVYPGPGFVQMAV